MRPGRKPRGFTLIELMVVVTIIGIMAGILLIAVMASRASARQMSCKNNLKQLASGLIHFETAPSG